MPFPEYLPVSANDQDPADALHRSEEVFRLFVESVTDYAIFFLNSEGKITSWNLGAERIKGYTADEIIGQSASLLYTPEQAAAGDPERDLAEARRTGRFEGQGWRRRKDDTLFWSEETVTLLPGPYGSPNGFAVICRDLTARREAEQERARLLAAEQAARQEAEAANRTKDRFLAALSHELRTPLTPVEFGLHGLRREKNLSTAAQATLEMISRNLDSQLRLIGDLLDVSRIVHGKLDLRRQPVELHHCLLQTLEVCRADIDEQGIQLNVDFAATDDRVFGDSQRLEQVFWNLLKNAAKFTPPDGQISVRSRGPVDSSLIVTVADTGRGISPEMLVKIFDAFEQGNAEVTQRFGGLGLGLAISYAIVEAHGGKLAAASEGENHGTTFTVTLPLLSAASEALSSFKDSRTRSEG